MSELKKVFGIDLGTTYSCISYVDEFGKAVVVPNQENDRVTPSVVFFDGSNIIVGNVAKENSKIYPNDVVSFVKRAMGDEFFIFSHQGKDYKPEEISSFILRKLVNDAEIYLNEKITDVVITCPAYFGINEREATRNAGVIAGLNVRQIINEPTAAAISYGMERDDSKVVLVYDLGGGTFDITMIDVRPESIQVIGTGGDHNLGGKDWDDAVVRYLVSQFQEQTGIMEDILDDPDTAQELLLQAEKAKITLSQRDKAPVSVNYSGHRAKVELTREKLEEITKNLLERTITLTKDMLEEAKKKGYSSFDEILLVGGSSRMPQVMLAIKSAFPQIEPKLFDPDESVAKGAAIFGWKLTIDEELQKRIAADSGKKVEEVSMDTVSKVEIEKAAQDVADSLGLTLGAVKKATVKIKNVTSKSFGIKAFKNDKEILFNLISKNDVVPVSKTQRFGTREFNQESVEVKIMENELTSQIIEDLSICTEIGTAELTLPKNLPEDSPIDVTFTLNEEGRLDIRAIEKVGNREVLITISTGSIMTKEEVEEAKSRAKDMVVS
ncbi:Hsp70 family protein [bacterium]|nr:Hsp70 family protein [bacterium]